LANLKAAVERLDAHDRIDVAARSSVYETEPVGEIFSQPDFYNAVVAVQTDLPPRDLLAACKRIERELGRPEGGARHSPRPIDVDLLVVDVVTLAEPDLVLPHPELANRRFVLAPLQEVAPDLTLADGSTLSEALAAIGEDQRAVKVPGASLVG
jgi:2-amino-4-hydroxy-6-hydroxymethyldihydropteridine diphosphokinase